MKNFKKPLTILVLPGITLILSSCDMNGRQIPAYVTTAKQYPIDAPAAAEAIMTVDYQNEYAKKIIFTANTIIKDFKYIKFKHNANDTGFTYFEGAVFYSGELSPESHFGF